MRLAAYVVLLFSLSTVFYFLGYTSPFLQTLSNQGCTQEKIAAAQAAGVELNCALDIRELLTKLATNLTTDRSLQELIGISIVGFAALLLAGFGAIYLIPLIMLMVFLNYVVFPISFIADPALPDFIKLPMVLFFNVLTILAIITFIRGSS